MANIKPTSASNDDEQSAARQLDAVDLTGDERFALTAGTTMWHSAGVERFGIPPIKVSDGPAGIRGAYWSGTTSACVPCGSALGASWDPEVTRAVGAVLADEARAKGVDIILAPTVNLHRSPLAGRNFECFSEDPHLTGELAVGYVEGIQDAPGLAPVRSCIKHFVANDQETRRMSISAVVDERPLRELYLYPFEQVTKRAQVASLMTSYNRINGTFAAQHERLLGILRGEWGWDGLVMSDWFGTKAGKESVEAGLDMEMPGPGAFCGQELAADPPSDEALTRAADRVLSVLNDSSRPGMTDSAVHERSEDLPEHRQALRTAAARCIVLVKNDVVGDRPVLPAAPEAVRSIAVIGPNAATSTILGGGSAAVNPHHVVTVADGLAAAYPNAELTYAPGCHGSETLPPLDRHVTVSSTDPRTGLLVELYPEGDIDAPWDSPVLSQRIVRAYAIFMGSPAPGLPGAPYRARMSAIVTLPADGIHHFSFSCGGRGRLLIDGEVVAENLTHREPGESFFGVGSAELFVSIDGVAGQQVHVALEIVPLDGIPMSGLTIGYRQGLGDHPIEEAVAAASTADLAVVVVGLNAAAETEGQDRSSLELPEGQADLIRAVAAANPRTVVCINAGAAVDVSWMDEVPSVLWLGYLGQEQGHAVADVLAGAVNPGGKMGFTVPHALDDVASTANFPGDEETVRYEEGMFIGYRDADRRPEPPAIPFGHGTSYTSFELGDARLETTAATPTSLDDVVATVRVSLRNRGLVAGSEVVQVYVGPAAPTGDEPIRQLRGFARVDVDRDASEEVAISLTGRAFAHWGDDGWSIEPGAHVVWVGTSSAELGQPIECVPSQPR